MLLLEVVTRDSTDPPAHERGLDQLFPSLGTANAYTNHQLVRRFIPTTPRLPNRPYLAFLSLSIQSGTSQPESLITLAIERR
jgi:hypothetical protein